MASYRDAKIQLDTVETQLRTLLLDAAAHSDTDTSDSAPTVLRFTGGWVRDKLLQQSSHDIDVSVSNMTGAQFSQRLQTFLDTTPDSAKKYGNVAFHTIAANPDKSKHLETVTTRILGLDIDFVNLRKETYSEDSRNPQMEFGTPEEDALRRDATVNALFYNISTDTVEDFTTKGLDDMQAKIIRTPLDPYQTFMDDPLRVLRLIRFASRLGFELDGPVQQAMKDQSIQDALRKKISRERVEIELSKMLRGHDPHLAIALIHRAGLYDTIFCDPEQPTEGDMAPYSTELLSIANQLRTLLGTGEQSPTSLLVRSQDDRYLSWILACLVPYRDAVEDIKVGSGKAPTPKAAIVVRDGLKSTRNICALVTSAVRNRSSITAKVNARQSQTARDDLGMAVRGWGATWRLQVMYALLADIADEPGLKDDIFRNYTQFVDNIQSLDLLDVCEAKTIIDGKALAGALGIKPGPWMKDALEVVMAWQLRNPDATDPSSAIEQVRASRSNGELTADLVRHFLRLTIRPLFQKDPHPAVTSQGRKVTTRILPGKGDLNLTAEEKAPWKKEPIALPLLRWAVHASNVALLEENWSLIIPPLLSVIDDTNEEYKAQGCEILQILLATLPTSLLVKTGLTHVFQDALLPCLLHLPTLTPPEKSVPLLNNAFSALFSLLHTAYPSDPNSGARTAMLDAILRKGIFSAYAHCSNVPTVTTVLMNNLAISISELGIESVRHIKHILPALSQALSDPFAAVNPSAALAATSALQALILNGWPRMVDNRGEVLRAICLGWKRITEDEHPADGVEEVKVQLQRCVAMLADVVKECDFENECRSLVEADGQLDGLFASVARQD